MKITKEFLEKYKYNFNQIKNFLPLDKLEVFSNDFEQSINEFKKIEDQNRKIFSDILGEECPFFYKGRVKDVEHFIIKIIRDMSLDNKYKTQIENDQINIYEQYKDLLGLRIISLNTNDKLLIFHKILEKKLNEIYKIKFFYSLEEPDVISEIENIQKRYPNICEISKRDTMTPYNSIHIIFKVSDKENTKLKYYEMQIRTYFEEAWAEVDHQLKYPYDMNNDFLKNQMKILYEISKISDEIISSTIKYKKRILETNDIKYYSQFDDILAKNIAEGTKDNNSEEKIKEIIKQTIKNRNKIIKINI